MKATQLHDRIRYERQHTDGWRAFWKNLPKPEPKWEAEGWEAARRKDKARKIYLEYHEE